MPYRIKPPKRWPARDEVRALARQFTVKAMNRLIELIDSDSDYVSVHAARTVLMRGQPEPMKKPRFKRIGQQGISEVSVKIAPFKQEKKGGYRDRKLPVVPRRRQGPRDTRDGEGAGVPALPGQRPGVRDEP